MCPCTLLVFICCFVSCVLYSVYIYVFCTALENIAVRRFIKINLLLLLLLGEFWQIWPMAGDFLFKNILKAKENPKIYNHFSLII